ncbi:isochorismate synthase [Rhodocaloribacter sp.]
MHDQSSAISTEPGPDAVLARERLVQKVRRVLLGGNGSRAGREKIVRVSVPIAPVDPFDWLHARKETEKMYWAGRRDGMAVAAAGVADVCAGEAGPVYAPLAAHLAPMLETAPDGARYFGGIRFDTERPVDDDWRSFGAYRFVLPRFELVKRGGMHDLACNLVLPRDRERLPAIVAEIALLTTPSEAVDGPLPLPSTRHDMPDVEGWRRNIMWALDAFTHTGLDKVVLARKATYTFAEDVPPDLLLRHLERVTPNCFHFLFQSPGGDAFVGATPERLFRREGRSIRSEAVAGTRPRGETTIADERLREELLHSEKDQREHEYVRRSIGETLRPLCVRLDVDAAASEMALARGRHLVSGIHGTLREGVTTLDLLEGLHPTPAVGGYPKDAAQAAIRRLEPFDRGWYAGPVGWIGRGAAEFAVALRCGLVRERRLSLFSGAGIVLGSTPDAEWEEIEHKIVDFIKVFGLDLRRAK